MPTEKLFYSLSGTWNLSRTYTSLLPTLPSGSSTGTAHFTPSSPSHYLYSEQTLLTPNDGSAPIQGIQKYTYRYNENRINVHFTDGRLFHEIDVNGWKAEAPHLCPPDTYKVRYRFYFKEEVLSSWTIDYEVKGPQKNYSMSTLYTKKQ
jgi:hypothetical protein